MPANGMKVRQVLQSLGVIAVVTLTALEVILRAVDLRELRDDVSECSLTYLLDVAGSPVRLQ